MFEHCHSVWSETVKSHGINVVHWWPIAWLSRHNQRVSNLNKTAWVPWTMFKYFKLPPPKKKKKEKKIIEQFMLYWTALINDECVLSTISLLQQLLLIFATISFGTVSDGLRWAMGLLMISFILDFAYFTQKHLSWGINCDCFQWFWNALLVCTQGFSLKLNTLHGQRILPMCSLILDF